MRKKSMLHRITARWHYNPIWMGLLRLMGKSVKDKKWVFIIGCYNSGTTLLDQIFASHPQISGLPDEGVMLTSHLVRPEDFGWRRMWSQCEEEMENCSRSKRKKASVIKRHWSNFYDLKKPFLMEKSISNSTRLRFLEKNFQPAIFIHLIRNGYAVAEGIYRKAEVMPGNRYEELGHYPMALCAKQWVKSLEVVESFKNENNVVEIKYEDLVHNPAKIVNSILVKLGLDRFPDDYFDKSFSIHEKQSEIKNMNPKSFDRLTQENYMKINDIAGTFLDKYGYERREG